MPGKIEERVVIGVAPDGQGDGAPLVLIGVPRGAWEYMRDGRTHHFDLTSIGLPVKFCLFGAPNHDAARKVIENHNAGLGLSTLDLRREDFAIKPKGGR